MAREGARLEEMGVATALPVRLGAGMGGSPSSGAMLGTAAGLWAEVSDRAAKGVERSKLVSIARSGSAPHVPDEALPGCGRRVLVVEDDPMQARLLRFHLERMGFVVEVAPDGSAGLDLARSWRPEAIVSDVLMPGMDGFRLCAAVRCERGLDSTPVVLVSSAFVEDADRRLAKRAGADAFVERTPDLGGVVGAVISQLGGEGRSRRCSRLPTAEYADRMATQMVRQATLRADTARRLALVEEKLGVLAGLIGVLKHQAPTDVLLDELLHRALEVAGVPRAAAYLLEADGALRLRAVLGLSDAGTGAFPRLLGGPHTLRAWIRRGEPLRVPSAEVAPEAGYHLLAQFDASSLMAVPLVSADEPLGALVFGCTEHEEEDGAAPLLVGIASQVGQAVALARALTSLRESDEERGRLLAAEREARMELEARVAELNAANEELESFAYSVSHDLRAPLRAIDGFSRILIEKYSAGIVPEAVRYLGLVRAGAQQMGCLIDDLLSFSRLANQPLNRRQVLPANIVRQVLEDLAPEMDGRQVDTMLGELPACQADPALLRHVYQNLLSNAIKYTRRRERAVVEIGCLEKNGEAVYFVRDNGVGFDMRYARRLFGAFRRLHKVEEYEGTGVGLAIVRRIVHRHGGRVWADAAVDRGATFYFTIGGDAHV